MPRRPTISAGRLLVDELFSTVPVLNFDMRMISTRDKTPFRNCPISSEVPNGFILFKPECY